MSESVCHDPGWAAAVVELASAMLPFPEPEELPGKTLVCYIGGLWMTADGRRFMVTQTGADGTLLSVRDLTDGTRHSGVFDSLERFHLTWQSGSTLDGVLTDDGARIIWANGEADWYR